MVPYLKSIHQTLDSWRPGRDADGWKLSLEELREFYAEEKEDTNVDSETPAKVQAVPRLTEFIVGWRGTIQGSCSCQKEWVGRLWNGGRIW